MMRYTDRHPPGSGYAEHRIGDRSGWVAVWSWPERLVGTRPLTRTCSHVHRSEGAALACARTRTDNVAAR